MKNENNITVDDLANCIIKMRAEADLATRYRIREYLKDFNKAITEHDANGIAFWRKQLEFAIDRRRHIVIADRLLNNQSYNIAFTIMGEGK